VPHFTSPMPAAGTFGTATLVLIYAFSGFESALVPAGESRNPSRDMPVALLTALGAVTVLYIVIQVVSAAAVPDIGGSASPLLDAAHALMGPTGAAVIALGVIASVGGNLLGSMFSAPRLTYALALDGSLPRAFATVHPRFLTPAHSILFYGSLTFLLAVIGSFAWLAATAVLARLILYMLACAAVPRLRRTDAGPRGLRLPGGHLFPLLGIVACVWLTLQVERNSFMLTAGLVGLGTFLYALAARQMRPPAPAASLD
jgi:amino acid transporter